MVDKSEKFNWLVRVGYFSRAVLYAVLGFIALTGASRIGEGTDGIFEAIEGYPAGIAILWIMAVGLTAYALFRFCSPLFDIENHGTDTKGWATRIGHAGSGIGHLVLAFSSYQFANAVRGEDGNGTQEVAAGVLSYDFGGTVLGLLGVIFFIVAIFQARKGISGEFMQRISSRAPEATRWLGGAGYFARAVVYAVIGWSLFRAGFLSGSADEVVSLGDAVGSLSDQGVLFTLTAIGLLMFGIFSLVLARYRIIPDLDSSTGIPKFRL